MSRHDRPSGWVPTMAVAGDVDPAPLRAAGWTLRGALSGLPYADLPAGWHTATELAADDSVDAVAVDGSDPELVAVLPELRASGLLLLLPTAAPLDPQGVRAARAVPVTACAVGCVCTPMAATKPGATSFSRHFWAPRNTVSALRL